MYHERVHKPSKLEFFIALLIAIALIGSIFSEKIFHIPYGITLALIGIFVILKVRHISKHGGTIIEDYLALMLIILFGILHTILQGQINAVLVSIILFVLFSSAGFMLWVKSMLERESVTHFIASYGIFVFIIVLMFAGTYYSNSARFFEFGVPTQLTFSEALYFSTITFTTVGFGDITPLGINRGLAAFEALLAVIFNTAFIGYILTAKKW